MDKDGKMTRRLLRYKYDTGYTIYRYVTIFAHSIRKCTDRGYLVNITNKEVGIKHSINNIDNNIICFV